METVNRVSCFVWTILFLCGFAVFAATDSGFFLPLNGDFSKIRDNFPVGWTARGPVNFVSDEHWQSSGILRLSVRPQSFVTCVSAPIPVKPESVYRFRWFCRTADFSGARAYVYLEIGKRQQVLADVSIRGNSDWCEFVSSYLPRPGETALRFVLTTHAYSEVKAESASAFFAGISVQENPPPAILSKDEMLMKFPVTRSFGCQRRGNRFYLDPETYVQGEGESFLSLEAEKGQLIFQEEGGIGSDEAGSYIDFVANAKYTFWVRQPGSYYRWLRTWRPTAAHYCHHESANGAAPGALLTDYVEKVQKWEWVRGPAYEFSEPGFHRFTLHNFYAGIRLDKLVFSLDENFDPEQLALPETQRQYPPQGELYTSSWQMLPVQEWLSFQWPATPVQAPVQLFWSSAGQKFQPVQPTLLSEALGKIAVAQALRFKLVLTPTPEDWQLQRIANLAVADTAELRARIQPGQLVKLENDLFFILFNRENGALSGIFNKAQSLWCYQQGVYSSPFALTLFDPETRQSRVVSAESFSLSSRDIGSQSAQFTYESQAESLQVTCIYELGTAELSNWRIQVKNLGKQNLVSKTRFPNFSSLCIGAKTADDTMIFPQSYRRRLRSGERTLNKNSYFPGSMAMGWLDLYDHNGGFYVAIDDPKMLLTGMYAGNSRENDGFEVQFEKNHALAPGEESRWDYVVGVHTGDWHWAADQYRDLSSAWLQPADLPVWLREANGIYCYSAQWQGSGLFQRLPAVYQQARRHGLDALQVWGQQSYPKGPCGDAFYFPSPHFGTEAEFIEANRRIHALGGYVGYYQWMNWNVTYETSPRVAFDTIEKSSLPADIYFPRPGFAADNQLITEEGKTQFFTLDSMKQQQCTLMCATQMEQRDYLKYYTQRYAEKYHADGFYMDEGIIKARPCYNQRHQHCGNGQVGAAMVAALGEMLATGRKYNPNFFLTHEVPSCAAGQFGAHFVGVFETDLDIVKYTFPQQLYLDGNLPVARRKQPFEGLRTVFMLGNQLMLFPFSGTFSGDSGALIQLRRQLRRFFAYAIYRDTVGLRLDDSSIDCRWFKIDFAGNAGVLLTVSNPKELFERKVFCNATDFPAAGTAGFTLLLDGKVTPLVSKAIGSELVLPLPAAKVSALILLSRVTPSWQLLPVLSRQQDAEELKYEIQILNLGAAKATGTAQLTLAENNSTQTEFSVMPHAITSFSLRLPWTELQKGWQQSDLLIQSVEYDFQEKDFALK